MQAIQCEGAMSDDVLQAARTALSNYLQPFPGMGAYETRWIKQLPEKQQPLIPLLMALLDGAEAVARAIDDNAWDDGIPVDRKLAEDFANQAYRIGAAISNASSAHDVNNWSLPSMTGKELV